MNTIKRLFLSFNELFFYLKYIFYCFIKIFTAKSKRDRYAHSEE